LTALVILTVTFQAGKHHEECDCYFWASPPLQKPDGAHILEGNNTTVTFTKESEEFSQRSSAVSVLGVGGG
jgi:hypothetical protein